MQAIIFFQPPPQVSTSNSNGFWSLRFCGGLFLDVKRKLPFFASDFYDALHIQALSTILFIYLGTVTNAITFGGLLGDATENMQVLNPPLPQLHSAFLRADAPQMCQSSSVKAVKVPITRPPLCL